MEQHKTGTWLHDLILGGQDGLVNVLGIVLGVSAANGTQPIIIAASMAAAFAEAISMGAVAYTSTLANKDHYESERKRELTEIEKVPETERKEVYDIYFSKGFRGQLLDEIVNTISKDKEVWVNLMMDEELHLQKVDTKKIMFSSVTVGVSAIIGSLVPVIPFFVLPLSLAVPVCLLFSGLVLFAVGVYKAKTSVGVWWKSGLQMFAIGMGSAIAGYVIGLIFNTVSIQ